MAGRKLMLRVDRHGRLVEVVNWQLVRDAANSLAGEFAAALARSSVPVAQATAAIEQFKAKFASEANVRALAMREAQLLFLMLGHRYDSTHPTEYAAVVSNPIGEGLTSVTERVESALDGNAIVLDWTQRANRSAKGLAREGEPIVRGRASFDMRTGWPTSVVQTTSAIVGDSERSEVTSLQRQ